MVGVDPEMLWLPADADETSDQLEHLHELMAALNEEVAAERNETGLTEAAIRRTVRNELQRAETDGGS